MDIRYTFLDQGGELVECGVMKAEGAVELAAQFMLAHGSDPDEDGAAAAPGTIICEPVRQGETLLRRLQIAVQWVLDDLDANMEDGNVDTYELIESLDNARAALAESELQLPPTEGAGEDG